MINESVRIIEKNILSNKRYVLSNIVFDQKNKDGEWQRVEREAYDRGNGAAILLYNKQKRSIILTRQFRMPTYINGNPSGLLIEVCAGLLDDLEPEECIKKETEEETGFIVHHVQKVLQAYMSPGSVTEIIHFFIAEYDENMKANEGGGLTDDHENIEVLELHFDHALEMIKSGEITDAKTILLLYYAKINQLL
jgi:nudix-type nucleoside diphosphatase (YffH/AdpP family)